MDSKSALDKIKEAELKAQQMLQQAKEESRRILQSAQLEREKIIQDVSVRAGLKSEELRSKMQEEAIRTSSSIKSQAEAEKEKVKIAAQANIAAALDFLKSNLE